MLQDSSNSNLSTPGTPQGRFPEGAKSKSPDYQPEFFAWMHHFNVLVLSALPIKAIEYARSSAVRAQAL
jgi:hypothetical protein